MFADILQEEVSCWLYSQASQPQCAQSQRCLMNDTTSQVLQLSSFFQDCFVKILYLNCNGRKCYFVFGIKIFKNIKIPYKIDRMEFIATHRSVTYNNSQTHNLSRFLSFFVKIVMDKSATLSSDKNKPPIEIPYRMDRVEFIANPLTCNLQQFIDT